MSKPACEKTHAKVCIIGVDLDDCRAYYEAALRQGAPWEGWRGITPRTHQARGWVGPVFATPSAETHPFYDQLLWHARFTGLTCTCFDAWPRVA